MRTPALHGSLVFAAAIALAGCRAPTCGDCQPPPQTTWSQLFSELPGALVSVWGSSASDVWTVGGDAGDGKGPMALHYDGKAWTRYLTGLHGDLWWVFGFAGGPVFMGGQTGVVLRRDASGFTTLKTPATPGTVYGIWGPSPTDLWAVGGGGEMPAAPFIWHYDGNAWAPDPRAPADLASGGTVYKVWGRGDGDAWFVGAQGLVLHFDGKAFTKVALPDAVKDTTLFTVTGTAARAYAVGADGVIVENDGSWKLVAHGGNQMNGVCALNDAAFAAGAHATVQRRDPSGWVVEPSGIEMTYDYDFHGCWVDPDGGAWFVGGVIGSFPLVRGVLHYRGRADVPGATYQTSN